MSSIFRRLKERKLVQWSLAYLAGAFVVLQLMDALSEALRLTPAVQTVIVVLLLVGLLLAIVIAWYHGEKGQQRVGGQELTIIAASLAAAALAIGELTIRLALPTFLDLQQTRRLVHKSTHRTNTDHSTSGCG